MKKFVLIPTDKYERLLKNSTDSLLDTKQSRIDQTKEDITEDLIPNFAPSYNDERLNRKNNLQKEPWSISSDETKQLTTGDQNSIKLVPPPAEPDDSIYAL